MASKKVRQRGQPLHAGVHHIMTGATMHMHVDKPWQDETISGVEEGCLRDGKVVAEGGNTAIVNGEVGLNKAAR